VLLNIAPAAHRLDEYLQAARVSLSTDAVVVELDLTPGVAVAPSVLTAIDADGDARLSPSEQRAYADRLQQDVHVAIDGRALQISNMRTEYPSLEALADGTGTIRLEMRATFAEPTAGRHELRLRNDHRPDVGVYLANALVPATNAVAITGQHRDRDQRDLLVEYDIVSSGVAPIAMVVPVLVALLGTVGYMRYRRA
jgi:hypothetical protein